MTVVTANYTLPYDWTTGETITEALLDATNSNIMFLKTPTQDRITAGATTNTTSTSYVDIALATRTITTNAFKANVAFSGAGSISVAGTVLVTLLIDGVNVGDSVAGITGFTGGINGAGNLGFFFPTATLTAASHIFKLQWKTTAGTATLNNGWTFYVWEA
jgi:hypothetical protein